MTGRGLTAPRTRSCSDSTRSEEDKKRNRWQVMRPLFPRILICTHARRHPQVRPPRRAGPPTFPPFRLAFFCVLKLVLIFSGPHTTKTQKNTCNYSPVSLFFQPLVVLPPPAVIVYYLPKEGLSETILPDFSSLWNGSDLVQTVSCRVSSPFS